MITKCYMVPKAGFEPALRVDDKGFASDIEPK